MTNYDRLKEYEAHKEPLPSYDEYKRLQEQLKQANNVIKGYIRHIGFERYSPADSYCERWGVK